MASTPTNVGRYQIIHAIGMGGMGALYLAMDPALDRQIAVKILRGDDDELRERFAREARSAARLRHPNIVTIFDVGQHEGQPFIAMEYIKGQTLGDLIRSRTPLPMARKLKLMQELCDGLGFAHKARIVHRDIKPANIMVDEDGLLKILDFGIARLAEATGMTHAGMLIGTLNYMSPEQLSGQPVDSRSDIFAVGLVFYELLTSRQAFSGGLNDGILARILTTEPESLASLGITVSPDIQRILARALEKDPANRYQDLSAMRRDLEEAARRIDTSVEAKTEITDPATIVVDPTPTPMRRGVDREDLAKRRMSRIQTQLDQAQRDFAAGQFEATIAGCEQVLMLDPDAPTAVELLDKARGAIEERQERALVAEAEQALQRGALTQARSSLDRAAAFHPTSARVAELRGALDEAVRARDREHAHADAIRHAIERAQAFFESGAYPEAATTADEALALDPQCEPALVLKRRALERQSAKEAAERARQERLAAALAAARSEMIAHRPGVALERLRAIEVADGSTPEIAGLIQDATRAEAERQRAEDERRKAEEAHRQAEEERRRAEEDRLRAEAERQRVRDEAVAAAIRTAKHASSHEAAIAALLEAEPLDPGNAEVRHLLEVERAAFERERAEHQRAQHIDDTRRSVEALIESGAVDDAEQMLATAELSLDAKAAFKPLHKAIKQLRSAAEQARVAAEKARAAERDRLAAGERAQAAERDRLAAAEKARAAERDRLAAEAARAAAAQHEAATVIMKPASSEAPTIITRAAAPEPRPAPTPSPKTLPTPAPVTPAAQTVNRGPIYLGAAAAALLLVVGYFIFGRTPPPPTPPATASSQPAGVVPPAAATSPAPLTVPVSHPPAAAPTTAPPPTPAAATVAPPTGAPADRALDSQIEGLRVTAARLYGRADRVGALAAATDALKRKPQDPETKALIDAWQRDALGELTRSRGAADQVGPAAAATASYRDADSKARESALLVKSGKPDQALPIEWSAAEQFTKAAEEGTKTNAESAAVKPAAPPPSSAAIAPPPKPETVAPSPAAPPAAQPAAPEPKGPTAADEEAAVKRALDTYAQAYSTLNFDLLQRVWPTVDSRIRQAFGDLKSQTLLFTTEKITVTGATATATTTGTLAVEPRTGSGQKASIKPIFKLQKFGTEWLIVSKTG